MRKTRLGFIEFTALIGTLFATVAFSIDAMLPVLPQIGQDLASSIPNHEQLVIASYIFGLGIGTLAAGPLSDSIGRRPVILGGCVVYILAAFVAWRAQCIEVMLAARVVQGIGTGGPRIAGTALIRDLFKGRDMAKVMSFAMVIFVLFPAVAPFIGQEIARIFGWRAIFIAFMAFGAVSLAWFALRQAETLGPADKRPLSAKALVAAFNELSRSRIVVIYTLALSLAFGTLFALISSVHSIFKVTYGQEESFAMWFAIVAILSGASHFLNAFLVAKLGMRRLVEIGLLALFSLSALATFLFTCGILSLQLSFYFHVLWMGGLFLMSGFIIGNLNALAMEPAGHIAGFAASYISAISTMLAALIAMAIGLSFDGTPVPLYAGAFLCSLGAYGLMRLNPKETHQAQAGE